MALLILWFIVSIINYDVEATGLLISQSISKEELFWSLKF